MIALCVVVVSTFFFSDFVLYCMILRWTGVFVSKQKGDTDMGSKVPKDILVKGESLLHLPVEFSTGHLT